LTIRAIYENEIKILAQYGIALQGTEFKPGINITQRDFLYLLAKSINPYMEYDVDANSDESLYNYLINSKIVKENEKAPAATVTKQDAVKFIIRSLKYDHIADIKGIYTLSFKDKDKIIRLCNEYIEKCNSLNIKDDDFVPNKPDFNLNIGVFKDDISILLNNRDKQYNDVRNAIKKTYETIEAWYLKNASRNKINPTVGMFYLNSAYGYAQKTEHTVKEDITAPTYDNVANKQ
jgi:hypothetical protein